MNTHASSGDPLDQLTQHLAQRIAEQLHRLQQEAESDRAQGGTGSPWLSIDSAARYLDWPKQRLYKLTAAGAIPHYKQDGRLLFHQAELDSWIRQHAQHSPATLDLLRPDRSYVASHDNNA